MPAKIVDFLLDSRNPLYLIPNYIKKKRLESQLNKVEIPEGTKVNLALTFDIEYDFGSKGEKTTECVGPFLDEIGKILGEKKIPATFFVQGNLVEKYKTRLLRLEKSGHEIGLHGWAHEPWGDAWFIKERVPSLNERERFLEKSLSEFENCGLRRPVSFRAPNMVIDKDSLSLLEKNGFRIDSSAPSYKGVPPIITKMGKIIEIPVSADPIPSFSKKLSTFYKVFNLCNLSSRISNISENAVKFQILHGKEPCLVFLAHPWEFYENELFGYCSEKNFELDLFKKYLVSFSPRYATLNSLTK